MLSCKKYLSFAHLLFQFFYYICLVLEFPKLEPSVLPLPKIWIWIWIFLCCFDMWHDHFNLPYPWDICSTAFLLVPGLTRNNASLRGNDHDIIHRSCSFLMNFGRIGMFIACQINCLWLEIIALCFSLCNSLIIMTSLLNKLFHICILVFYFLT